MYRNAKAKRDELSKGPEEKSKLFNEGDGERRRARSLSAVKKDAEV